MKSSRLFLAALIFSILTSCSAPEVINQNNRFELLAKNFIQQYLEIKPLTATGLGDHRYDHRVADYSPTGVEQERKLYETTLTELKAIDLNQLGPDYRTDYKILQASLESALFELDVIKEHEWNPLLYNPGGYIYLLIARDFAPLKERLQNAEERLKAIPVFLEIAKANLKNPPQIHTQTAILQNKGTISLIRDQLKQYLDQVPELKEEFAPVQAQAVASLESYGTWLEKELLPKSNGDFRLGDDKYGKRLHYVLQADMTKEEILANAEADLKKTQEEMYHIAFSLHQKLFPQYKEASGIDRKQVIKEVLDKLAESHPTNENIVELAKQDLQSCIEFVKRNNIATVSDEPVKVIVMPEFLRGGGNVAYCDSPGPLEKNGETFYAISPTPKDWTSPQIESLYREYNNAMLQVLTIHEAMPGHYFQITKANKFKAPTMVRGVFNNEPFVEGWAVYSEGVMTEKGYGGLEVKLHQLKFLLRTIINSILDQKIHTSGMTEKEAIDFMMNEGFQERSEAENKWRRACLTSTQLSTYYVGYLGIRDLRKSYEAKFGALDIKAMHDNILSYGSIAPKYIKELMGL